jgi:hypothetical protein
MIPFKKYSSLLSFLFLIVCNPMLHSQTTYSESFEGAFRPPGWGGSTVVGTYDWGQSNIYVNTGLNAAWFNSYDAPIGNDATLITPVFSLCAATTAHTVGFWMYRDDFTYTTDVDYIQVYVNTSASLAGATSLGVVNRLYSLAPVATANTWNHYTYTIPAGFNTATNFIIFKAVSDYGNSMFIDDVTWVSDPCPVGPANDLCSGAIPVTCGNVYAGSTATATTLGDPSTYCGTTPGAPGVFYSFVGNGQLVTADLCGSAYNTKINIYSGSCGSLNCVDGNDDNCGVQSDIIFPTGVGTTYYILVNGSAAATGAYSLNISCAPPTVANDDCTNAINLTENAGCVNTGGTTTGATFSLPGCVGNADDDVWYQFTATSTSPQITVTPTIATFDPVVELLSGICTSLTTLVCQDVNGVNVAETIASSGLTIGTVYYVRVYHFGAGSGGGTFNICVTDPPPVPSNDNCAGATTLTEHVGCINIAGTTVGATSSGGACSGSGAQDVWYAFTVTNSTANITLTPSATMDAVIQLYSGSCGALTSIVCQDAGGTGVAEVISAIGLITSPPTTYYLQVSDYLGSGQAFNVCVAGPAAAAAPSNDAPCNAIAFPPVTTACNFQTFTTVGATQEVIVAGQPPLPSGCIGGSGGSAGYVTNSCAGDVWFSFVASAADITITAQPNVAFPPGITSEDASMALYSGTCNNLTQIYCSSDNSAPAATAYPGPANNKLLPYINTAGTPLTIGNTYFIRYWSFGSAAAGCANGTFGLCIQNTTNNTCANAILICDLNNGYSSSTSNAYKPPSWPSNMLGNDEASPGVSNGGANSGGVFGKVDPAGDANLPATEGVSLFDVAIDNNSWVRFTAASTKVTLTVTVGTCFKVPAKGIQMQIFSTNPVGGCAAFAPAAPFYQSTTGFTMTANNLVIGNSYIIMIDGFAGDICNYTISAGSGVLLPAITASANPVCLDNSVVLTAPASTTYSWNTVPSQTTQAITVTPGANTTYTCVVTGSCGEKQTLTIPVAVSTSCAALPITLVSFDAIYKGGEDTYLLWETSSEINNGFFTVERSVNAKDFVKIGTVNSKAPGGNSSLPLYYTLVDPNVSEGTYYYRLGQTDLDGQNTYSGMATITIDKSDAAFGVKPNPTNSKTEITYTAFENCTALLKVFDFKGALVSHSELNAVTGKNIALIDLGDKPAGIYFITLSANEKMYKCKLVKKNE